MMNQVLQVTNNNDPQGFDLTAADTTLIYFVGQVAVCSVQIVTSATTSVVKIQRSNDGAHPVDLEVAQSITGAGMSATIDCTGFQYLHVTVQTAQASKQADVYAIGKSG